MTVAVEETPSWEMRLLRALPWLLLAVMVVGITLVAVIARRGLSPWQPVVFGFLAVYLVAILGYVLAFRWSERRSGEVVRDCGARSYKKPSVWVTLGALGGITTSGLNGPWAPLGLATAILILVQFWAFSAVAHTLQIRTGGLWMHGTLIRWSRIHSHRWLGAKRARLVLVVADGAGLRTTISHRVPLEHKDAVDAAIRGHVAGDA